MLFKLLRVRAAQLLSSFTGAASEKKKRSKGYAVMIIIVVVICAVMLAGMFGVYFMQMCEAFYAAGIGWFYFAMAGLVCFALCFVGSAFMSSYQLFRAKDNELLLSMPIKPGAILGSRMAALVMMNYLYGALVIIPAGVVWCICAPVKPFGAVAFVIGSLLLPLIAVALSALIGWLISLASTRVKHKSLITMIFSIAFLALYMWGYSQIFSYVQKLIENGAEIAAAVRRAAPPAYWFGVASESGSVPEFILFVLCCIVPFAIAYAIIAANFTRITTTNRGMKKTKYREKNLRASGARAALLRKEYRRFTGSPMYMMNAGLGLIFMLVLAVFIAIKQDMISMIFGELVPGGEESAIVTGLMSAGLCFCTVMTLISAPSVSLEGNKLWILRSVPVRTRDVLMAKVLCHLTIALPFSVIASAIIAVSMHLGTANTVLLILLPASATVFSAFMGLFFNLMFPKLDWLNEVSAVKQGASTLIAMFIGMGSVVILVVLYILLSGLIGMKLYLTLCIVFYLVLSAAAYLYIRGAGCRKFESLTA